ncbi:class I SAM-dependent DNA methyltransferase [Quadrisphaera sp. GCM10027208]|uniref:HsdM family class I SAM-dependent methyltransferase n=1 Tax=Quadrisphaera sp. GCM10027208 TaxID=3273423 RepID=UPI0036213211
MANEASSNAEIRAALRAAGYELIQFEPRLEGSSKYRPDVLAFASNGQGDLVPWLVVEVRKGPMKTPELALPALTQGRELLGTVEHYAVVNGQWYRADRSLRSFEPVPGPKPLANGANGFLTDPALVTSLLIDKLWFEADKARMSGARVDNAFPPVDLIAETTLPGIETASGGFVPVRPDVLWQARRRALSAFAARSRHGGQQASDPVIAEAVAQLLGSKVGGTVLDPFCGTGSFLWAVMDRAAQLDGPAEFIGRDIDANLAALASEIGRTAPMLTFVEAGDAFRSELPEADAIVTAPPFGGRVEDRWSLLNGGSTSEHEIAAIDLCLRHLRPGGRAVFHLPSGFTFRHSSESYRQFLASEFRVAALIGLPAGTSPGTNIRTVLLVVDRDEPGETFVAQLGDDWRTQLTGEGTVVRAALGHIDGLPESD